MTNNELYHHGILGMHWGVRRYQNKDGTLTAKGKEKKKKSRKDKLKEAYMKKGFKEEAAEKKAKGRIAVEVLLAASGAALIGGVVAAALIKRGRVQLDTKVFSGEMWQRVKREGNTELHDIFFATNDKRDFRKYRGLYGNQIKNYLMSGSNIFKMNFENKDEIKIAGHKTGKDVYKFLLKNNPNFKPSYKNYKDFNTNAFLLSSSKDRDIFINELKKRGYGGIRDINDELFSGYDSKGAKIMFKNDDNFIKRTIIPLMDNEINNDYKVEQAKIYGKKLIKELSLLSGAGFGIGALNAIEEDNEYIRKNNKKKE